MKLHLTLFLYLFCLSIVLSQSNDEWIVSFDSEPSELVLKSNDNLITDVKLLCSDLNIYLISYPEVVNRKYITGQLSNNKNVRHITPNADVELRRTPNDSLYGDQYHLGLIQADRAWDITTGNSSGDSDYVIAMLDDGFDINHSDILPNLWTNDAEIANDGIDNDNNGFVDDYLGLNIETNDDAHYNEEHGSQVLGVLAANGNNSVGISGVMWDANILLISGVSNIAEVISALDYSYEMKKLYIESNGAKGANVIVTNFAGGLRRVFPEDFPDWCPMYDLLGTVGILSVTAVANESYDVDDEGDMPTLCDSPYLITVSFTDRTDQIDEDSAYGATSVDISAPGENIISTTVGNKYAEDSGTSFSSPQVTGAIGLMYNIGCEGLKEQYNEDPAKLAIEIKSTLLSSADEKPSLSESVSKGRLNIYNSLIKVIELCGGSALGELEVFSVAPNPISNSDLSLGSLEYTTDVFSEHTFLINDAMGRLVYSQKFFPSVFSEKRFFLDQVPYLDNGAYSFSIMNENSIRSTSVIVIR